MDTQPSSEKRSGKCNGYGHPPDCICGWGGVYYPVAMLSNSSGSSIPPAGTRRVWEHTDLCRPSTCPKCRQPVFFVRHNGGSVWFDSLGQPWPKHPCMATEPDMAWLQRGIPGGIEPGSRQVFGVILEARVIEPGVSAFFVISCSDGTIIENEFAYTLNPCETVGGLVVLELTPDNQVGARRFKAIEDMLEAHRARLTIEERRKQQEEKRRKTLAENDPRSRRMTMVITGNCTQGKIKLRMVMDTGHPPVVNIGDIDYGALHLISTKVKIEIIPAGKSRPKFAITLPSVDAVKLIGGTAPCSETYESICTAICVRKGLKPPSHLS